MGNSRDEAELLILLMQEHIRHGKFNLIIDLMSSTAPGAEMKFKRRACDVLHWKLSLELFKIGLLRVKFDI